MRAELTARELEVLRGVAAGLSYRQLAHGWGIAEITVRGYGHRLMAKLGANSIAHAVHIAHVCGLIGAYPDCGSRAAYLRHLRRREPTCTACRAANARHAVDQRAGRLGQREAA